MGGMVIVVPLAGLGHRPENSVPYFCGNGCSFAAEFLASELGSCVGKNVGPGLTGRSEQFLINANSPRAFPVLTAKQHPVTVWVRSSHGLPW